MASISANGSRGHHNFTLNVNETYVSGGAENYSTVSWSLVLSPVQSGWDWAISGVNYSVNVDGTNWSGSIPSYNGSSTVTIASGSKNVGHDSDGGKWIGFDFSINDTAGKTYTPGNASSSGGMWLTKISRYPTYTTNPYLVSKTETSVTFDFGALDIPSDLYYSTNNSTWTHASTTRPTITGLSANTAYTIYCQARNQSDNSLTTTKTISVTTYNYPYCTSSPNFIIGNSVTLSLYNPLSRNCTVSILSSSNTTLASGTTSSTSITGFNAQETINNLYASIPNSTSGTYKVKVVYSSSTKTRANNNTYSVNTTTSKPTFNLFEYEDINATTLALTGDSSVCIPRYSTIQATVSTSNKAIANNSATISKYQLAIGNDINETNYSDSQDVTMSIANAKTNSYTIYAIDSRGLSTPVTLTGTQIAYTDIAKDLTSTLERQTEVGEPTVLTLKGSIWKGNFGQVNNGIESVTYRYKSSTASTYTDGTTTITPTVDNDGNFTFTGLILGDTQAGFDIDKSYSVIVEVTDKLSTAQYTFTLVSGTPHVAYAQNGVSIMGKYDETLGGALQVNGVRRDGVYLEEEQKVGYWINGKPIYQKTIDFTIENGTHSTAHNISNIEYVVDYTINGGIQNPFIMMAGNYSRIQYSIYQITTTKINSISSSSDDVTVKVTIWYTKTTDPTPSS